MHPGGPFYVKSFSGMDYLPTDLEYLGIGEAKQKKHSLRFLKRFSSLRELYIDGQTKDIEVISELVTLEDVTLRSISLPDLSILLTVREAAFPRYKTRRNKGPGSTS